MSIEIQVRTVQFARVVACAAQAQVAAICFPPLEGSHIDHIDVVEDGVRLVTGPPGTVLATVPLAVFVAREADLEASVNVPDPPYATVPFGRLTATFSIAAVPEGGAQLTLTDLRSDPPLPSIDPALNAIRERLPAFPPLDVSAVFSALHLPTPRSRAVALGDDVLTFRFDAAGPVVSHLTSAQEWGLFISGDTMQELVLGLIPNLPLGLSASATWSPVDGVPRVGLRITGKVPVPDPFSATAEVPATVAFSLARLAPPILRATVNRDRLQIHAAGIPGFIEATIESQVEEKFAQEFDASALGAAGDSRTFYFDRTMTEPSLLGGVWRISSLVADAAGMIVGGRVGLPVASWERLSVSITQFGLPAWFGTCRSTGQNRPPTDLGLDDLTSDARVDLFDTGSICGVTVTDTSGIVTSYGHLPAEGPNPGQSEHVGFSIPASVAPDVTHDVGVLVRTSRGIRRVNLGHPVISLRPDGTPEFTVSFIDDCFRLTDDQLYLIEWLQGKKPHVGGDILKPPPKEHPDWGVFVNSAAGFETQLVTLNGLDSGELVSFGSAHHSITVSADTSGRVVVPVMLSLTADAGPASLSRVNRKELTGKSAVRSAMFQPGPTLTSGDVNRLSTTPEDAEVIRTVRGVTKTHGFEASGLRPAAVRELRRRRENEVNPQPLPPDPPPDIVEFTAKLPGFHELVPIPGFETEPIVVARLQDGTALLVERDSDSEVRVAGTFSGPIGRLTTAGDWSLHEAPKRLTVFGRTLR